MGGGLQTLLGDEEPRLVHLLVPKLELCMVKHHPAKAASVKEGTDGKVVSLHILAQEDAIINTFKMVGEVPDDFVSSLCVTITSTADPRELSCICTDHRGL